MKKITLDMDALRVESFEVRPERAPRRGTVRGYATAAGTNCLACSDDAICTLGFRCTPGCPPEV